MIESKMRIPGSEETLELLGIASGNERRLSGFRVHGSFLLAFLVYVRFVDVGQCVLQRPIQLG